MKRRYKVFVPVRDGTPVSDPDGLPLLYESESQARAREGDLGFKSRVEVREAELIIKPRRSRK